MTRYLAEIIDLLGSDRRKLPFLLLLFLASSLLDLLSIGLIGPYAALLVNGGAVEGRLGYIVEAAGLSRNRQTVASFFGVILIAVFVFKAAAAIGIHAAILRFTQNQRARLQSALMRSYQQLPYAEHLRRNSSEYLHAMEGMATDFSTVVQVLLRTTSDAVVALALLIFLAWYNAIALVLLAAAVTATIATYDRLFRRNLKAYGEKANRAGTALMQAIHEGIEGLKEIRVLGRESYFHRQVHRAADDYAKLVARAHVIMAAPRHLLEIAIVVFVVVLVVTTIALQQDLGVAIATLAAFGLAAFRILPAAAAVSTNLIQLRYARNSISRLHKDLCGIRSLSLDATPNPAPSTPPFRSLALDEIRYSYPDSATPALDGLSLRIQAGESVGLIGPSGAGKTTLVDVLLGLLQPHEGRVLYNDQPLRDVLPAWRERVAYLPQQTFLLDNTLRRNIALGVDDADIDEERIRESLRQARLADFVSELPEGLGTIIGERGMRLSGGQRQRVALARAFYHGREVLVMDEATSALDEELEREIVDEIRRLKRQKTLIVIAHRLSTVQCCDRVFRLSGGHLVQEGSYDEVVR